MSFTGSDDISKIRSYYLKGSSDTKSANELMNATTGKTEALYKAYNGTAWGFKAKHSANPVKKLEYVKKGLALLNEAVLADAINVEIRFLRFSVEENIPSIVSFKSHVEADKKMIIGSLSPTHAFYSTMKAYMLKSKNLTEEEKKKLR